LMPGSAEVDPYVVLARLGISGITSVTPVTGGQDTLIWRVERGADTYALRLFRADQREAAQREALAISTAEALLPVPKIVAQGIWANRPVVLLEWCEGVPLFHYLLQHPEAVGELGRAFGRMQAQLHTLPAPAQLAPPTALHDWLQPLDVILAARLRALPLRPAALLHLDYHPMNVLTDGRRITAVLDWVNALPGDPRADVARTTTILRINPFASPLPTGLRQLRRALERAWREGYQEVAGKLSDMPLFYALAGLAMQHDLAPRVAKADHWLQPQHLEPVRRWTRYWRHCAGL
jgi:aminoglycoside phosphotransferase (APT) family kinase protein